MKTVLRDADHRYTVDGVRRPGIHEILKALGLDSEYEKVPAPILARALERGTFVHELCALHDQDHLDPATVDPALAGYHAAWIKFREDFEPDPRFIETPLAHDLYQYCGTPDRAGLYRGQPTIPEIKTGKSVPKTVALQLTAQRMLLEANGWSSERTRLVVVQLGADGSLNVMDVPKQDGSWLACLSVYQLQRSFRG